jgi:UDP-N-acetyl-D-galactosamine dehydrogenase
VILAGRRINNSMGKYVAEQTVKLLSQVERPVSDLRVGVLGLTFKENVPDLRNSRVPDIVNELKEYGIQVVVHDPLAEPEEAVGEYGLRLSPWDQLKQLDGIVLAVAHREYMQMSVSELLKPLRKQRNNVVVDVKSVLNPDSLPGSVKYWRL